MRLCDMMIAMVITIFKGSPISKGEDFLKCGGGGRTHVNDDNISRVFPALTGLATLLSELNTVKLLNNGHPFCRGLVAVVDECPLVSGCGKMSTNPCVWRGQGRLINTKSVPRSFRPTKKWTDLQDRTYEWYISSCISSRPPWSFIS